MLRPLVLAISATFSMICACSPGVTPTLMSSASADPAAKAASAAAMMNFFMGVSCVELWFVVKGSVFPVALVEAAGKPVAGALDELYENDQHDYDHHHHLGIEALVAIADAEI